MKFYKLLWGSIFAYGLITLPFLGAVLLSYDEAHYALYGYNLAWSYFDHPPLVGWIQWFILLISDSEWFLRVPAFLSSCSVLICLGYLLAELRVTNSYSTNDCKEQWIIALVLFLSAPVFLLLSFAFLPETLLMAWSIPLLFQTRKTASSGKWKDYIFLGVLFGLAGLSKYTALLPALGAAAYILWFRGWRTIMNPRSWLALIIALVIFSPVIWWNIANDGASFGYQLGDGLGRKWLDWQNVFLSQLFQLVAYGPLLYCLSFVAAIWIIINRHKDLYILLFFATPCFLLFFISPAFGRFLPYWVSYMFVMMLPAVAIMLQSWWRHLLSKFKNSKGKINLGKLMPKQWASLGTIILLFILSYSLIVPIRLLISGLQVTTPPYTNPVAQLTGWDKIVDEINQVIKEDEIIFVNNWSYASPLGWYGRPTRVIVLSERLSQFDYWYGRPEARMNGYLVVPNFDAEGKRWLDDFDSCNLWGSRDYNVGRNPAIRFDVYYCSNYL